MITADTVEYWLVDLAEGDTALAIVAGKLLLFGSRACACTCAGA